MDWIPLIDSYRIAWHEGKKTSTRPLEMQVEWPEKGIALLGDLSGIQNFVYRPTPGVGGAARRLRSRSFRVSAYTELIARWCMQQLNANKPRLLYSAGGRFLIVAELFGNWKDKIAQLQAEIDMWAWNTFEGELVFHLVAAPFASTNIPNEMLLDELKRRRNRPLAGSLQNSGCWRTDEFVRSSKTGYERCDSCGATRSVQMRGDEAKVCNFCVQDETVGSKLPQSRFARIGPGEGNLISAMNLTLQLDEKFETSNAQWVLAFREPLEKAEAWWLLRHVPTKQGKTLDFEEIAETACGQRKWLGCLRIDADQVGRHFATLQGNPVKVWGLSRLLNYFFANEAEGILKEQHSNIYAVYGGGDDLFVIGPWNDTLDFSLALYRRFRQIFEGKLTFSAGLALAKPRDHVLSMAYAAKEQLEEAKHVPGYGQLTSRNAIRALGVTCPWDKFGDVLQRAKQVRQWVESGSLPAHFVHQTLKLHNAWLATLRKQPAPNSADTVRHRPLLYYQICRNLKSGDAFRWAHSLLHQSSDWPWVGFILRYALLAAERNSD